MEIDYYEALGVEPEETADAEGANDSTDTGSNGAGVENKEVEDNPSIAGTETGEEKNPADGDSDSAENNPSGDGEETPHPSADADTFPSEGKASEEKKRLPQSAEDNARFAAARRKAEAEREATVARVREEAKQFADERIADVLKTANFSNPYTGEPIRTMAEFNAYKARLQEEQRGAFMQQSGMTDEQYKAFIESQPEVQEAKAAQKKAEAVIREAREREAKAKIDEQVKEITALNPAITSLSDLTKLASYPELYEKVRRGYSIVDAYKLTNMADIESRAVQRAQQQTINAVQSKSHLEKTRTRGTGSVEVPADVKAE